jgi:septal ring-binding cell division protein DamX
MPWQLNGHYYSFTEASIRANVPPVSGVYGLYNIRYQVLIGESANIRTTLLRHESEMRFGFGPYRPTGFTFEIQPPESRAQRARELIREYRPVRQTAFTFVRPWKPVKHPGANVLISPAPSENHGANHEKRPDEREKKVQSVLSGRNQLLAVAIGFAVATVAGVFLGDSTATKNGQTLKVESQQAAAKLPVRPGLDEPASESREALQQDPLTESSEAQLVTPEPSREAEAPDPAPLETKSAKPTPQGTSAARSASQTADGGSLLAVGKDTQSSRKANPGATDRRWTIQVKASPDRAIASGWLDRLTKKGYQAFIVEADIRGQTWYRVRVGNFGAWQEAERARKTLESEEGFSDAFVAAGSADHAMVSRGR